MSSPIISSGVPGLDEAIQGLRLGDNVVWRVNRLEDYRHFAEPFAKRSIADGRRLVYLRFASHPPILTPREGLEIIELTAKPGFDAFTIEVHELVEALGKEVFYVFDNLSSLAQEWATDELLANWFQVTCPHLYELHTVAYFALNRGQHIHSAVARIRTTPQVLLDVYRVKGQLYVHPVKVLGRYSPHMFLPHVASGRIWQHVVQSGEAANVSATARKRPLRGAEPSSAPWDAVYQKLIQHVEAGEDLPESSPEVLQLKRQLSRMILGTHPKFDVLAEKYLSLDDLLGIRNRLVGSGRIGGKAAGMVLAGKILRTPDGTTDLASAIEHHDSFYIGSDVFFTFLVVNDLFRLRLKITRSGEISREEFHDLEQLFVRGQFPSEVTEQLRNMLDYYGQAPVIVRSSSLLEDSFGNAFAGKYHSEFLANQGSPDERLAAFEAAIKRVYASALNPDALSYRRRRGLRESNEQMAVLVQRVSGMPYGDKFFPSMAGVAFSRNLYAWNERIDPKQGVIRLVFGLGTRAVDRVGGDYPRMLAVSAPELRPERGMEVVKYSQHQVDLLDLQANALVTAPFAKVLDGMDYPNLHLFVSERAGEHVKDPITRDVEGPSRNLVLTFNNLVRRTDFVKNVGAMLSKLDREYGQAVDIEFTAHARDDGAIRVNVLQCRPLFLPGTPGPVTVPTDLPPERVLFRSSRMVSGGEVHGIRHILYVDPRVYAAMPIPARQSLGREVGRVNSHPKVAAGKLITMGPGRWGSSNIELGVNVGYADIDNTSVLVELAREEAGQTPEVSYGTHFFQDLVEAQIVYLPVYPDDPASSFNHEFFASAPNALTSLLPNSADVTDVLHVIDVPAATGGRHAHVVADPHTQRAACYLE